MNPRDRIPLSVWAVVAVIIALCILAPDGVFSR